MNFKTTLTSEVKDSTISIRTEIQGIMNKHWIDVINTKEKMVQDGLIALGWTPPADKGAK